ncbi:4Fe-4S binding protein [Desulfovibrio sp. MES5]|uniref:4Fe-4S binding protein n=1 Tax=Desulfovibrio sp. MES5 TaxID=1899016 RepID=UPI0025BFF799|nr:4Fe-4S binding protein [Desulfovibrio sp. MES5]
MSQTTDSAHEIAKSAAQAHTPSSEVSVLVPAPEKRHLTPPLLRRGIQGAFAIFLTWVGWNFYLYVQWTMGKSQAFTPKPPSVEGFLPISELMAARRLFETGMWDAVHPAGLTLFLAIALMALLFRKGFCGYICPVGLASNLLGRVGERLGLNRNPSRKLELALQAIKYIPLALLCYFSLLVMSVDEIDSFMGAPFNMVADSSMLFFFLRASTTTFIVVGVIVVASLVVRNAWCRYLCPYGAFLGILALASPVAVRRNADACTSCRRCQRACPSAIAVHQKARINSPECLGCTACIEACPQKGCLHLSAMNRRIPFWTVAAGCLVVLFAAYLWAVSTGHWTSEIPPAMLRRFHMIQFGG